MTGAAPPRTAGERGDTATHVLRGTGLFLMGTLAARGLGMVGKGLIARDFTVHEFGLLSMGLSALGMLQPIALAGVTSGLPRLIGFHKGRGTTSRLADVVRAALAMGVLLGGGLGVGLFLCAGLVARGLNAPDLAPVLRVFALCLPFATVNSVVLAAYRGLGHVRENVIFEHLLANVLKFGFVLLGVLVGLPFHQVVLAYLVASALETVALLVYSLPRIRGAGVGRVRPDAVRELSVFSLPLLGSDALSAAGRQGGAMLLGAMVSPASAGLFSAAVLMVSAISMLYRAMRFTFLPVSSRLVGDGDHEGLGMLYNTVKRWVTGITFPLAGTLVVLARPILEGVFGPPYGQVALPLQILVLGQFIGIWVGPNGTTLVAAGHPRVLMRATGLASVTALTLAVLLIPPLGLTGAALASAGSSLLATGLISYRLYEHTSLHPLSPGFVRATGAMGVGLGAGAALAWLLGAAPLFLVLLLLVPALTLFSVGGIVLLDGVEGTDRLVMAQMQARLRRLAPSRKLL